MSGGEPEVYTYRDAMRTVRFTIDMDGATVVSIEEGVEDANRHVMSVEIDAQALAELVGVAVPILERVEVDRRERELLAAQERERHMRVQSRKLFLVTHSRSSSPAAITVHLASCVHAEGISIGSKIAATEACDALVRSRREVWKLCRRCKPAGESTKQLDSILRRVLDADTRSALRVALVQREQELLSQRAAIESPGM